MSAELTATNSLLQNAGASGGGIWLLDPSYVDGGNNIDTDPLFVTPVNPSSAPTTAGDLHLQSGSPAIDAGDNAYVNVSFDLDDLPRIVDGDGDFVPTVDMGAYEFPAYGYLLIYAPLVLR